ncbi:MAG: DNA translocase FtsK 4TM domain-containing protein, partial [Vicinamibacteria bacterium]
MSTSRSLYRKAAEVERSAHRERLSEVIGVCLLALSLMVGVSLMSYFRGDPAWYFKETSRLTTENLIGPVGAFLSEALFQLLGLAAYSVVILLAVAGWNRFWCHKVEAGWSENFGLVSTLLSLAGLLALSLQEVPLKGVLLPAGGAVGHLLAAYLSYALGEAGAFILLVTTLFAAIMVATRWSLSQGVKRVSVWQRAKAADLITAFAHFRESRRKEKLRNRVVKKHARRTLDAAKNKARPEDDPVARVEQARAK